MERFKADDTIAYSNTWVDDVYHKTVATKPHGKSPEKWVGTVTVDFTGCSEQDVREYAASRAIIEWQSGFRGKCCPKPKKDGTVAPGLSEDARVEYPTAINMKEKMEAARKTTDPLAQARKQKAKMSPEQKRALMEELAAELGETDTEAES
jgi:hypothetical protein